MTMHSAFLKLKDRCPHSIRESTLDWVAWMNAEGTKLKMHRDLLSDWIVRALVLETDRDRGKA